LRLHYDESKATRNTASPRHRWEDVPEGWECPDCGVSKADFEVVEVTAA